MNSPDAHGGPIRVGVVGTGPITELFAAAVHEVDGIEIGAVYSRDAERGADAARRLGAAASVTTLEDLLASDLVDAVYVASPNGVHAEQCLRALTAGKHVLVEKPAVDSAAEWRRLTDVARDRGIVLLEAMRTAYDPGTALVRSLVPRIGRIRHANLRHISRSARYDLVLAGERVNIFDPALGGGALRDLGVYCVYVMSTLFGMPRRVFNAASVIDSGADGAGAALAQYDDFVVTLEYSKITNSRLPSQICGEDGTISIDHLASPRVVELERHDGATERYVIDEPQHTLVGEVARFVDLIVNAWDASSDQRSTEICIGLIGAMEEAFRMSPWVDSPRQRPLD